jgi:hypothetical protein
MKQKDGDQKVPETGEEVTEDFATLEIGCLKINVTCMARVP